MRAFIFLEGAVVRCALRRSLARPPLRASKPTLRAWIAAVSGVTHPKRWACEHFPRNTHTVCSPAKESTYSTYRNRKRPLSSLFRPGDARPMTRSGLYSLRWGESGGPRDELARACGAAPRRFRAEAAKHRAAGSRFPARKSAANESKNARRTRLPDGKVTTKLSTSHPMQSRKIIPRDFHYSTYTLIF